MTNSILVNTMDQEIKDYFIEVLIKARKLVKPRGYIKNIVEFLLRNLYTDLQHLDKDLSIFFRAKELVEHINKPKKTHLLLYELFALMDLTLFMTTGRLKGFLLIERITEYLYQKKEYLNQRSLSIVYYHVFSSILRKLLTNTLFTEEIAIEEYEFYLFKFSDYTENFQIEVPERLKEKTFELKLIKFLPLFIDSLLLAEIKQDFAEIIEYENKDQKINRILKTNFDSIIKILERKNKDRKLLKIKTPLHFAISLIHMIDMKKEQRILKQKEESRHSRKRIKNKLQGIIERNRDLFKEILDKLYLTQYKEFKELQKRAVNTKEQTNRLIEEEIVISQNISKAKMIKEKMISPEGRDYYEKRIKELNKDIRRKEQQIKEKQQQYDQLKRKIEEIKQLPKGFT